ncbi:hypothetical protein M0R45_030772 [Rubus argutus]|uniref:Secreted protein n=1 Tax=Rubus argutus TaxID=59490 RepID=A0AAW1WCU4_RUBAR
MGLFVYRPEPGYGCFFMGLAFLLCLAGCDPSLADLVIAWPVEFLRGQRGLLILSGGNDSHRRRQMFLPFLSCSVGAYLRRRET